MQLDPQQTRLLYLSGTVALPGPFPTVGVVSIEQHCLQFPPDNRNEMQRFVVVQQVLGPQQRVTHLVRVDRVAGIFFPAATKADAGAPAQSLANCRDAGSADGFWFLSPDIEAGAIAAKLKISPEALGSRASTARGIVFVGEREPVLTQTEVGQTAAEAADELVTSTPIMFCSSSN